MATISYYHDTRSIKKDGSYPVKLQVYFRPKRKYYSTKFNLTIADFEKTWLSNPRKTSEYGKTKNRMEALLNHAKDVEENLKPFSFDVFEKRMYRSKGSGILVSYHFKQTIDKFRKMNKISSMDSFIYSEKNIKNFVAHRNKGQYEELTFFDITEDWLKEFQNYLTNIKQRSITTVKIYTENIRKVFNEAIREQDFKRSEHYPFGKHKYKIPNTAKVKKALSRDEIKKLFISMPETPEQEKAKDFFFFSYACNGINLKDIALLKFGKLSKEKFEFIRAKTISTSDKIKPTTVYLNDYSRSIINKYSNDDNAPNNYVFSIINDTMSAERKHRSIKAFNRFINQHIKKLAEANDLPGELSYYWARHSFATISVRNGATMEFMQESLGHENITTTQNYFDGFDKETRKEFSQSLMNF